MALYNPNIYTPIRPPRAPALGSTRLARMPAPYTPAQPLAKAGGGPMVAYGPGNTRTTFNTVPGAPANPAGKNPFDYSHDPILQGFNAFSMAQTQSAGAALKEQQRKALIQLGSRPLAERVLGADDPTLASISADENSMSMLGQILRQFNRALTGIDTATSQANTFWGSARAQDYGDTAYARQKDEFSAEQQILDLLTGYQDEYDAFIRGLARDRFGVEEGAYNRVLGQNMFTDNTPGNPVVNTVTPAAAIPAINRTLGPAAPMQTPYLPNRRPLRRRGVGGGAVRVM